MILVVKVVKSNLVYRAKFISEFSIVKKIPGSIEKHSLGSFAI